MKKLLAVFTAMAVGSMMMLSGCGSSSTTAYDYDLSEYITVGDYMGLTYDKPEEIKISDKEIETAIKSDLDGAQYLNDVKDGKVHDGDTVNIDYVGTIDGEEFEGGSATGSSLVIGSKQFIDGFETGLIGKKVGDTVTLKLKFPDDYGNEEVAGKDVKFEVKINASQEYVTPSEKRYVKNNENYKSVEEYEKAVEQRLYNEKEESQKAEIKNKLWKKILKSAEVKEYPEKEMTEYKDQVKKSIQDYADSNELEFADVIESYYDMDEEAFNEQLQTAAESNCKEQMAVYSIARAEKLEVSKDEYQEFIDAQLASIGYTAEQFEEYTGSSYVDYVGGENYIYFYMYYTKVIDLIMENAKVK